MELNPTKTYTVNIGNEQTIKYPGSRVVIKYGEQTRNGKLTVTPEEGVTYFGNGRVEIAGAGPYTVTMADSGTATREFIEIKSSCTVTLKQLNIYPNAQKVPAIDIDEGLKKVTLKLEGRNILKGSELAAAIDNHGDSAGDNRKRKSGCHSRLRVCGDRWQLLCIFCAGRQKYYDLRR